MQFQREDAGWARGGDGCLANGQPLATCAGCIKVRTEEAGDIFLEAREIDDPLKVESTLRALGSDLNEFCRDRDCDRLPPDANGTSDVRECECPV